ncbi:hypothetical protein [Acinetobacter silvestris]|uniref:Uncharacterized protein n=1 Tax=Acinetobacter silvestris TaxID=1977882 RepID=A0A1Y3C671_9GAMM|nr:hypothetical protein [Acinetobacter silvestris]OTG62220.1 hypothetical protein B9T28_14630 [Acinetobacter silvestris]
MTLISISLDEFKKLSLATQAEILSIFQPQISCENSEDLDGELTRRQVSNLINGLSDKSKNILRTIVRNFSHDDINYKDLLKNLGMTEDDNLTGVWSGITKRSRNAAVANDPSFDLIAWNTNEDNIYVGCMHPTTFKYMSEYFK